MKMRVAKVSQYDLLISLKNQVWGSDKDDVSSWVDGDLLVLMVTSEFSCLVKAVGKPYESITKVWDNGTYPFRIGIELIMYLDKAERKIVTDKIKKVLGHDHYQAFLGFRTINDNMISKEPAEIIYQLLIDALGQNSLIGSPDAIDEQIRIEKDIEREYSSFSNADHVTEIESADYQESDIKADTEWDLYRSVMFHLTDLGSAAHCSSFTPKDQSHRPFYPNKISDIKYNSRYQIDRTTVDKAMSLMDVIWSKDDNYCYTICAFKIDIALDMFPTLLELVHYQKACQDACMKFFLVASVNRILEIINEINTTAFRPYKSEIIQECGFLPIESLAEIYYKVGGLGPHLRPSIIELFTLRFGYASDGCLYQHDNFRHNVL